MKKYGYLLLLFVLLFTTGCGGIGNNSLSDEPLSMEQVEKGMASSSSDSADLSSAKDEIQNPTDPEKYPRKIIRNADLTVEVDQPHDTMREIEKELERLDGWVIESSSHGGEDDSYAELQVRLPVMKLDLFLVWLEMDRNVLNRRIYTNEITLEYYDAQARLENAHNQKQQYLLILKKANTIQDILEVQQHIDGVQERIDSLSRQLDVWNLQVDNSLVTIYLRQSKRTIVTNKDPKWNPLSAKEMVHRLRNGFVAFFSGFTTFIQNLFIWFITIWLWILLFGWLLWVLIRKILAKYKKGKSNKN